KCFLLRLVRIIPGVADHPSVRLAPGQCERIDSVEVLFKHRPLFGVERRPEPVNQVPLLRENLIQVPEERPIKSFRTLPSILITPIYWPPPLAEPVSADPIREVAMRDIGPWAAIGLNQFTEIPGYDLCGLARIKIGKNSAQLICGASLFGILLPPNNPLGFANAPSGDNLRVARFYLPRHFQPVRHRTLVVSYLLGSLAPVQTPLALVKLDQFRQCQFPLVPKGIGTFDIFLQFNRTKFVRRQFIRVPHPNLLKPRIRLHQFQAAPDPPLPDHEDVVTSYDG